MYQIAIDGCSGSGKSTVAKALAKEFGFYYLNTGEIYRAMACAYKEQFDEVNLQNVSKFTKSLQVEIVFQDGRQIVYVNGKSYTQSLRLEEISELSSKISTFDILRKKANTVQKKFAKENNVIMEGRDIGSVILPHADVKIFLTADIKARAERRYKQLSESEKQKTSLQEVLEDLQERDHRDKTRAVAPLKQTKDAILLDNSFVTLEETIAKAVQIVKEKLKI
ncbi:MAG: (d)CMP kinase [Clostridia bacterium]|nr:(d)CMP kinase [Clostridia bacterium]